MKRLIARNVIALAGIGLVLCAAQPASGQPQQRPATADEVLKQRYHINLMEGVLVRAVRHGADVLGSKLRPFNPNLVLLTGAARARGFLLDGYGVFFDVEIPALRESVAWSIRTLTMEPDPLVRQALAEMRRQIATLGDADARSRLQQTVSRMERQMLQGTAPAADAASARRVTSANVDQEQPGDVTAEAAPEPVNVLQDPNALYTDAVKVALIEAMLDHGAPMGLRADEWLTVAAKDAEGPLSPNEPYEAVTIVLRIKGSDLAAFRADRITRDEAMTRVEVREF